MNAIKIERLDHFGIVAGIIKDLKLTEMIDEHIPKDDQENISTGEAVAGMILNGLGFTQRPFSLTPQLLCKTPDFGKPQVESGGFLTPVARHLCLCKFGFQAPFQPDPA